MKYWLCIEALAEFYLSLANVDTNDKVFKECHEVVEFYRDIYAKDSLLTAADLFKSAAKNFVKD